MSNCCKNIVDLGCVSSCELITTNIIAPCNNTHYVLKYEFNGATVFTAIITQAGKNLVIPAKLFNENYSHTIEVLTANLTHIICYKVNISPTVNNGYIKGNVVNSNTVLEFISCVAGTVTVSATVTFEDINFVGMGGSFQLTVNGTGTVYYPSVTSGNAVIGINGVTMTDLNSNVVVVEFSFDNVVCDNPYSLYTSFNCFKNIPPMSIVGDNNKSNTIIQ